MKNSPLNFKVIGIVFVILMSGFLIIPSLMTITLLGMLPTIGALLADRSSMKMHAFCVGCCNIAGLLPILMELVQHRFSFTSAASIMINPEKMLIVLVCAAGGWGIAMIVPSLTVVYYRTKDRSSLNELTRKYAKLKETWGDAIPTYEVFKNIQGEGEHHGHSNHSQENSQPVESHLSSRIP